LTDIPDQEKMTLKADISYKSNWQQGALKSKTPCLLEQIANLINSSSSTPQQMDLCVENSHGRTQNLWF
jgi:hypothetical protein